MQIDMLEDGLQCFEGKMLSSQYGRLLQTLQRRKVLLCSRFIKKIRLVAFSLI